MNRRATLPASLPNEIWLYLFEHFLTPFQLKSIRLVCRNWNQLVRESSNLLDRYTLTVPVVHDAVERWQHVTNSRYTTVTVTNFTIGMVPTVPLATIRMLSLVNPWITARQLVEMLAFLPNLAHLRLAAACNFNYELYETMPALQLNRLECLDLNLGVKDEFLCIFQRICPRLKSLQVAMIVKKYLEAPYGTKLVELIRSTRNTLTQVCFNQIEFREESLLRDIAWIEGLKLKNVTFNASPVRPTDIADLCEAQPDIEALLLPSFFPGIDILTSIATYLPNLKELKFLTDLVDLQPILSNLPNLENLAMIYQSQVADVLDLSAWRNPKLLHLALNEFFLNAISLHNFCKGSPQIRTLKLCFSATICIHDVLVIAGQLKELRHLTVFLIDLTPSPAYFMDISFSPFRKLRQLRMFGQFFSTIIGMLLENCPLLQDLTLSGCSITDNDMLMLVQFMRNLTKLCFHQLHAIGVASGQLVVQRCPKLDTLTIVNCPLMGQFVPQQSSVRVIYHPFLYYIY